LLPNLQRLTNHWQEALAQLSFHQLCEEAAQASIANAKPNSHDFTI